MSQLPALGMLPLVIWFSMLVWRRERPLGERAHELGQLRSPSVAAMRSRVLGAGRPQELVADAAIAEPPEEEQLLPVVKT